MVSKSRAGTPERRGKWRLRALDYGTRAELTQMAQSPPNQQAPTIGPFPPEMWASTVLIDLLGVPAPGGDKANPAAMPETESHVTSLGEARRVADTAEGDARGCVSMNLVWSTRTWRPCQPLEGRYRHALQVSSVLGPNGRSPRDYRALGRP